MLVAFATLFPVVNPIGCAPISFVKVSLRKKCESPHLASTGNLSVFSLMSREETIVSARQPALRGRNLTKCGSTAESKAYVEEKQFGPTSPHSDGPQVQTVIVRDHNFGEQTLTSSVTHFEIYAEEPAKLADFYRSLFGWQVDEAPGIDYWRIRNDATGAGGFSGGLTYRPIPGLRSWVNYVNVASLDEALSQIQQLGGAVLRPKMAVPKTAWYAFVADPEGNVFAIWQADPTAFPPPDPD
jgi:hypothetical protein